jgi:hypothetical protein
MHARTNRDWNWSCLQQGWNQVPGAAATKQMAEILRESIRRLVMTREAGSDWAARAEIMPVLRGTIKCKSRIRVRCDRFIT